MLKLKIITKEEAVKLGLSSDRSELSGGRNNNNNFIYGVKGKANEDGSRTIEQHFKIDKETKKKYIIKETDEWKKIKKDCGMEE